MNTLVTVEYGEPMTTSLLIAEGVGNQHKNVNALIRKHIGKTKILSALQTRKIMTKGRPLELFLLNEKQATFLITLMNNSDLVLMFKEKLVEEFFDMRRRIDIAANNKNNHEWLAKRESGKVSRLESTDVMKEFIEYAEAQGSNTPKKYYMAISKMENKALWLVEGKFENLRDVLSGHQLHTIANADVIAARALKKGMDEKKDYKEIYKMARDDVIAFSKLIGKTPVPELVKFTNIKALTEPEPKP